MKLSTSTAPVTATPLERTERSTPGTLSVKHWRKKRKSSKLELLSLGQLCYVVRARVPSIDRRRDHSGVSLSGSRGRRSVDSVAKGRSEEDPSDKSSASFPALSRMPDGLFYVVACHRALKISDNIGVVSAEGNSTSSR